MSTVIHVIVSEGQSHNPAKRKLEDDVVAQLAARSDVRVLVVPNLYDLTPEGAVLTELHGISGDMIVLAWLYERATHWILDRHGIRGKIGDTLLRNEKPPDDDEDEEDQDETAADEEAKQRVIDSRDLPPRTIYCLDLRLRDSADAYVIEVARLVQQTRDNLAASEREGLLGWLQGTPQPEQLERYLSSNNVNGGNGGSGNGAALASGPVRVEDDAERRWYPVIDYSRCTNCMECIDFCLFGVYGVDRVETILVEQPDNCRKGCPACSRVCPENAIIFPQHKTPTIAGAPAVVGGFKIDLSRLFGAPDAVDVAVRERDEQLLLAGRDAVGANVGIPKRQEGKAREPADEFDQLLDKLDDLDV